MTMKNLKFYRTVKIEDEMRHNLIAIAPDIKNSYGKMFITKNLPSDKKSHSKLDLMTYGQFGVRSEEVFIELFGNKNTRAVNDVYSVLWNIIKDSNE